MNSIDLTGLDSRSQPLVGVSGLATRSLSVSAARAMDRPPKGPTGRADNSGRKQLRKGANVMARLRRILLALGVLAIAAIVVIDGFPIPFGWRNG